MLGFTIAGKCTLDVLIAKAEAKKGLGPSPEAKPVFTSVSIVTF